MTRSGISAVRLPSGAAESLRPPHEQSDRKAVGVFDAPESFASLATTLANIGYDAVACAPRSANRMLPASCSAAIISDALDDPLALAAALANRCPVLLATTETSFEARLAAARAGVDAVLSKPLDVGELAEWLDEFIGPRRDEPFAILIIDDDDILASSYALALENARMRATVAAGPRSALALITASFPDLVLMDMQMPEADGIELARIIRQSRRNLSLPIVFVSAERDPERQLAARRLGGDDFITKPVDPQRLVTLVRMRAERAIALRSMMEKDSLTGLLNHGRFKDRLGHELERCRRTGGEVSLALIDLDRFKQVNDSFGHLSGDHVLRALAHALSAGLRRIDVIGRYGGEEFGVILLDTPPEAACPVIDKLRARFSEVEFEAGRRPFSVTFSAGIAGSRAQSTSEGLIAAADRALYAAKAAGRNRILTG